MSDPTPQPNNPLALASLILGILSIVTLCGCYGSPFNLLAIVLGAVAISQINSNPLQGGKGLAKAGIGLGVTSIVLVGLLLVGSVFLGIGFGVLGAVLDSM